MAKVLITGIGGFIGRELARSLSSEGHEVWGVSSSDTKLANARAYKDDVCNKDRMEKLCKDKDVIIHLAAVTEHKHISGNPIKSLEISLAGTYNMLNAFEKSSAKSFIFPSSGKVYGKPQYLPYDEKHATNPDTHLGRIKKICEELISFFANCSEKSFSVLRIFNVYGPNQKKSFLIPTILSQADKNEVTLGDTESKRDYIYIKDVVNSFLTVMRNGKEGYHVYNVGSGCSYSAKGIVDEIGRLTNKKIEIKVDKSRLRKNETSDERANIEKLKNLGWNPEYDLKSGLSEILKIG